MRNKKTPILFKRQLGFNGFGRMFRLTCVNYFFFFFQFQFSRWLVFSLFLFSLFLFSFSRSASFCGFCFRLRYKIVNWKYVNFHFHFTIFFLSFFLGYGSFVCRQICFFSVFSTSLLSSNKSILFVFVDVDLVRFENIETKRIYLRIENEIIFWLLYFFCVIVASARIWVLSQTTNSIHSERIIVSNNFFVLFVLVFFFQRHKRALWLLLLFSVQTSVNKRRK